MRYNPEKVNEILGREDVAAYLERREKVCWNCERPVPPTHDGHFIVLLRAAVEDPNAERGGGMTFATSSCRHVEKYGNCSGDRDFVRRTDPNHRFYDENLREMRLLLATGEILRSESGRWSFVTNSISGTQQ
jgi:hypothetical protein